MRRTLITLWKHQLGRPLRTADANLANNSALSVWEGSAASTVASACSTSYASQGFTAIRHLSSASRFQHIRSAAANGLLVRQSQHLQLAFLPLAMQPTLQHAPAQLQQSRGFQLMPRRMKYRKAMKRMTYNHTIVPNTRQLAYGSFGIRAITPARVPAKTIEAIRRALRRKIKKTAKLWIRVAATVPITKKPAEIRMGKGKGAVDHYACIIRPGSIVFEMDRVSKTVALQALDSISYKCPFKVGFVEWN